MLHPIGIVPIASNARRRHLYRKVVHQATLEDSVPKSFPLRPTCTIANQALTKMDAGMYEADIKGWQPPQRVRMRSLGQIRLKLQ